MSEHCWLILFLKKTWCRFVTIFVFYIRLSWNLWLIFKMSLLRGEMCFCHLYIYLIVLTHCGLVMPLMSGSFVNIGSGDGLVPVDTKPSPKPLWSIITEQNSFPSLMFPFFLRWLSMTLSPFWPSDKWVNIWKLTSMYFMDCLSDAIGTMLRMLT